MRTGLIHFCLVLSVLSIGVGTAESGGNNLDGRMAPEMAFQAGLNGVGEGTALSAFRGKPVYIKFWLRDCPVCRRELPRVQDLYDRWGKAGLQVLTVVHGYSPAQVKPVMDQLGYDFPVVCDADGSQAKLFGVKSRPTDYLVGVDGRVKSSNGAPNNLIADELGQYRLAQLGQVPASMKQVRDEVWGGRMGTALRLAEEAGAAPGADEATKAVATRTRRLAEEILEARVHWAARLATRGRIGEASAEYEDVRLAFADSSLESRAAREADEFKRKIGG